MLVELTEEQRDILVGSANMRLQQKWMTCPERALLVVAKERLQMNLKFPGEFFQTEMVEDYENFKAFRTEQRCKRELQEIVAKLTAVWDELNG